jgi:hypothetical protein
MGPWLPFSIVAHPANVISISITNDNRIMVSYLSEHCAYRRTGRFVCNILETSARQRNRAPRARILPQQMSTRPTSVHKVRSVHAIHVLVP